MDISSISGITSDYLNSSAVRSLNDQTEEDSFSSVLSSVMSALDETNELQKTAESAEIQFALGESENMHDLTTAATKALVAIQYTTAVRDRLVEGYKELMQMQI